MVVMTVHILTGRRTETATTAVSLLPLLDTVTILVPPRVVGMGMLVCMVCVGVSVDACVTEGLY